MFRALIGFLLFGVSILISGVSFSRTPEESKALMHLLAPRVKVLSVSNNASTGLSKIKFQCEQQKGQVDLPQASVSCYNSRGACPAFKQLANKTVADPTNFKQIVEYEFSINPLPGNSIKMNLTCKNYYGLAYSYVLNNTPEPTRPIADITNVTLGGGLAEVDFSCTSSNANALDLKRRLQCAGKDCVIADTIMPLTRTRLSNGQEKAEGKVRIDFTTLPDKTAPENMGNLNFYCEDSVGSKTEEVLKSTEIALESTQKIQTTGVQGKLRNVVACQFADQRLDAGKLCKSMNITNNVEINCISTKYASTSGQKNLCALTFEGSVPPYDFSSSEVEIGSSCVGMRNKKAKIRPRTEYNPTINPDCQYEREMEFEIENPVGPIQAILNSPDMVVHGDVFGLYTGIRKNNKPIRPNETSGVTFSGNSYSVPPGYEDVPPNHEDGDLEPVTIDFEGSCIDPIIVSSPDECQQKACGSSSGINGCDVIEVQLYPIANGMFKCIPRARRDAKFENNSVYAYGMVYDNFGCPVSMYTGMALKNITSDVCNGFSVDALSYVFGSQHFLVFAPSRENDSNSRYRVSGSDFKNYHYRSSGFKCKRADNGNWGLARDRISITSTKFNQIADVHETVNVEVESIPNNPQELNYCHFNGLQDSGDLGFILNDVNFSRQLGNGIPYYHLLGPSSSNAKITYPLLPFNGAGNPMRCKDGWK